MFGAQQVFLRIFGSVDADRHITALRRSKVQLRLRTPPHSSGIPVKLENSAHVKRIYCD